MSQDDTTLCDDTLVDLATAARCCRVSTDTVRRWTRLHGLPSRPVPGRSRPCVRWGDLTAFCAYHGIPVVPPEECSPAK